MFPYNEHSGNDPHFSNDEFTRIFAFTEMLYADALRRQELHAAHVTGKTDAQRADGPRLSNETVATVYAGVINQIIDRCRPNHEDRMIYCNHEDGSSSIGLKSGPLPSMEEFQQAVAQVRKSLQSSLLFINPQITPRLERKSELAAQVLNPFAARHMAQEHAEHAPTANTAEIPPSDPRNIVNAETATVTGVPQEYIGKRR